MRNRPDPRLQRLFVEPRLEADAPVSLDRAQAHYLLNVLRLTDGAALLAFNGRDGEWRTALRVTGKRDAALVPTKRVREQSTAPDIDLLFAPLKRERLDYVVQKAVEMGAGRIRPVVTARTQGAKLKMERLRANAREAAEQCGRLDVPEVSEPEPLDAALNGWDGRTLVFCDEGADRSAPLGALANVPYGPAAVLVGPEGGFDERERERLLALPFVTALPLGPRILRADTAVVAAMALVQATMGDWE